MREGVKHEVSQEKESGEKRGIDYRGGMMKPAAKILEQFEWVQNNVPCIPSQESPDIDSQTTQPGGRNHKKPTGGAVPYAGRHPMDKMEREKAQAQPDESEQKNQDHVGPVEPAGESFKVNEVGDDVGCVGKENEPAKRRSKEFPMPCASGLEQEVELHRQQQGNPGQE